MGGPGRSLKPAGRLRGSVLAEPGRSRGPGRADNMAEAEGESLESWLSEYRRGPPPSPAPQPRPRSLTRTPGAPRFPSAPLGPPQPHPCPAFPRLPPGAAAGKRPGPCPSLRVWGDPEAVAVWARQRRGPVIGALILKKNIGQGRSAPPKLSLL